MKPIQLSEDIFCLPIHDQTTRLFEGLWPIDESGITYNSYLVRDEKTVLVDLCKELFQEEYLKEVRTLVDPAQIDYLVINHMEPDHSGALHAFRQAAPQATILGSARTVKMLDDFFGITENIRTVGDGEELALGNHTLRFISAPMVHWPETMFTYEVSTQILFPCDAFGGYGIPDKGIFDGDYNDLDFFEAESLRYYTNIVAAFSKPVLNAGDKLADLPVRMIAPSHGLVWNKNPQRIVDLYLKWSSYGKEPAEKGVTLLHGSMYGNTDKMVAEVKRGLEASGVPVTAHDVTTTPVSYILPALWVNRGVMIGAPTYEGTLFPTMQMVLHMADIKRVFNKQAAYFGSYGWGGGATRFLKAQCEKMNWELGEVLDFAGQPTAEDLKNAFEFAKRFGESIG